MTKKLINKQEELVEFITKKIAKYLARELTFGETTEYYVSDDILMRIMSKETTIHDFNINIEIYHKNVKVMCLNYDTEHDDIKYNFDENIGTREITKIIKAIRAYNEDIKGEY